MCVKFHDEENRLEIMGGAIAVHPGEFVENSKGIIYTLFQRVGEILIV